MTEARDLLRESLATIERLQARLDSSTRAAREPIAIVGVGCRYPGGVDSLDALWRVAADGVDAVRDVPADRWDIDAFYDPDPQAQGKMVTRRAGMLDRVDGFDPAFFGISPREARALDPQQRLILETCVEALESAAIATDKLSGSLTGVFVGASTTDYGRLLMPAGSVEEPDHYAGTGGALNSLAGRVAFTFGLQGPCVTLDTACSSALTAIHSACQALRARECDLALAGGVNVVLLPDAMVLFSRWGMLAPDGRCKTFDAAADGMVRGEGCGVVTLKRLSDAVAAGDPIRAVIRGSAVNSDGRSSGITVPNGPAQEAVVRAALASAGLSPADVDFVEAHGTGTPLGDPIEVEALAGSYGVGREAAHPLIVGAIKANLGHTEAASGAAGLLKVVAALEHEKIPAQINYNEPNPRIDWANIPVRVAEKPLDWRRGDRARRGGVSAFGLSGTNAHIVLEEAPLRPGRPSASLVGPTLVPLSAHSEAALRQLAGRHAEAIARLTHLSLADIVATLGAGRAHLPRRIAAIAGTPAELVTMLKAYAVGDSSSGIIEPNTRTQLRTAFLFTGQGAQYAGMGRGLYETEPVFRGVMDRAADLLGQVDGLGLLDAIYPPQGGGEVISQTQFTQPALFALEVGLAELWRSWGVTPSIVMGHSVGEYAAACVAGVFSFEDGLKLIAERGRLMQALPAGGAMAALFVTEADAIARIAAFDGRVSIAALNGPEETVISGDAEAVAAVVAQAGADGVGLRRLDVSHAFHSARLDPMLDAFEARAREVRFSAPRMPLLSNLTGEIMRKAPDARYWRDHARQPVRFAVSVQKLLAEGVGALVEIGPHPTLLALAGRAAPDATWISAPSLRNGKDDRAQIQEALGKLYVAGVTPKWDVVQAHGGGRRVPLPTYPFQNERYWIDRPEKKAAAPKGAHPLLGARQVAEPPNAAFVTTLDREQPAFLAEHVVLGRTLFPGAAFIEMALAAAREIKPGVETTLSGFSIESPLGLPEGEPQTVVTQVDQQDGRSQIRIRHVGERAWRDLARCTIGVAAPAAPGPVIADLRQAGLEARDVPAYYLYLEGLGLDYGPNFKAVRELWSSPTAGLGRLELAPDAPGARDAYNMHPAMLDAAFHVLGSALIAAYPDRRDVFLPIGAESIRWLRPARNVVWVGAKLRPSEDHNICVVDIAIENEDGEPVGSIEGLEVRTVDRETLERALDGGAQKVRTYLRTWREASGEPEPKEGLGPCLVVGGVGGFGQAVAGHLTEAGIATRFAASDDLDGLRDTLSAKGSAPTWVIASDLVDHGVSDLDPPKRAAVGYGRALRLAHLMAELAPQAGLCTLTRGAHAVDAGEPGDPAQTAVLGFARTLEMERPEAPGLRLDLDPAAPLDPSQATQLLRRFAGAESEIAVRRGAAYVQRLGALAAPVAPQANHRQVVRIETRGDLDNLTLTDERRRAPGRGEVEVEVRAAGLNFRDVLNALGMYPGDAGRLGSEVSGVIAAVGAGVTGFQVGDPVIAFTGDSIATHAVASAALTARLPAGADFADAVTAPNTYLTAALCFTSAGGLKPGMRVLVHAGAGGVGLAAVRLARLAGAEVYATAGSPAKRAFVLDEGAVQVFDSRKPVFADDILAATGGQGVDIVVNSLTGPFIPESFRSLRSGGVLVEIGKAEILTEEQAAALRSDVRYKVADLGAEILRDEAEVGRGLARAAADVASGRTPPLPVQAFALDDANAAFRFMANARHTGKIVLMAPKSPAVRRDGAYLVTGGLGGLGLETARWLVERGAGEVVLTARREPTEAQRALLDGLGAGGAVVRVARCDVSDPDALRALVDEIGASPRPLRGVFHAAGVLDDATLEGQDETRYAKVAAAKSGAAWRLSELTAGAQLDFFVMFSSSSAVFGSPGQANYSASNAFLDALATWRRAHGKAGTSIAWGAWDEVGMAARLDDRTRARWAQGGLGLLPPRQALAAMEKALAADLDQAAILALDTERFVANASPYVASLFDDIVSARAAGSDASSSSAEDADLFSSDLARRQDAVTAFIRKEIARVLGFPVAQLDENTPLLELGLDSLMAVQLRNAIARLGLDVPLKRLLQGPTALELTQELLQAVIPAASVEPEPEWEEGVL